MHNVPRSEVFHPFLGQDLWSLLASRVAGRRDHPFLVWEPFEGQPESWSYFRFAYTVERIAAGLAMCGLGAGDRILLHLDNCPEFLVALFACARIGAVAVTTNPRASGPEVAYYAGHAGVRAAVTQPSFSSLVAASAPNLDWLFVTETGESHAGPGHRFATLWSEEAPPARPPDPLAPLVVQYTSGTTSRPKGVVLTHANALWAGRVSASHEGLRAEDVHQIVLPLCHINALGYSVLASLWAGATVVLQPRFSASRFWDVAARNGSTCASLIPFCVRALLANPVPDHGFRRFGYPVCAPPTDKALKVRSLGWWGMTETLTHGIVGDPNEAGQPMTLGRPAPEYQLKILQEDGAPAGPGETGDLYIKGVPGVSLFAGYLDDPEATRQAYDAEGYFITGDRVTLAPGGALVFADRAKDMLKVGGENVAASEIERVIRAVPGVSEVAVVGRPDPLKDETPVAFVIANDDVDHEALRGRILAACATELASFKQPSEVRFTPDLPRATLDKVAKAELRKRVAAEASE